MKLFTPSPLRSLMGLVFLGSLCLTGCPQMTTGALSGGGAPLNATGEKTSSSTTDSDKTASDDSFVPASAAPVPSPAGGGDAGGLGGAGSGRADYETAMRRLDGPTTPGSEPITIARDGGVLSAPAASERIETFKGNVRVLGWPASVKREWTDYADFSRKLAECQNPVAVCRLTEEVARQVRVENGPIYLEGWEPSPAMLASGAVPIPESQLLNDWPLTVPGYYLFFVTNNGKNEDLGGGFDTVESLAELESLATDDRLRFSGEKNYIPLWTIPGLFNRHLFPLVIMPSDSGSTRP